MNNYKKTQRKNASNNVDETGEQRSRNCCRCCSRCWFYCCCVEFMKMKNQNKAFHNNVPLKKELKTKILQNLSTVQQCTAQLT